ncbi:MAG: hypothetical protein U9O87_11335 [Verrucomicrobiota bacterium]|nr:hypothetical protein [Verrucomicrobiota bacterium]
MTKRIGIIRCLDGMVYSILGTIVLLVCSPFAYDFLRRLNLYYAFPLFCFAIACIKLPDNYNKIEKWKKKVFILRFFSVSATLLSPFCSWWLRSENNIYFLICTMTAIISINILFIQLSDLDTSILKYCGKDKLAQEGRYIKFLILYFILVPCASIFTSILLNAMSELNFACLENFYVNNYAQLFVQFVLFVPLFLSFSLTLRTVQIYRKYEFEKEFHVLPSIENKE